MAHCELGMRWEKLETGVRAVGAAGILPAAALVLLLPVFFLRRTAPAGFEFSFLDCFFQGSFLLLFRRAKDSLGNAGFNSHNVECCFLVVVATASVGLDGCF